MNGKFDITLSALGMPEEQLKRKKIFILFYKNLTTNRVENEGPSST